jgi:hypothetical protein
MGRVKASSLVLMLVLMLPQRLTGQDTVDRPLKAALAGVAVGNTLNVSARGTRVEGTFLRVVTDSLTLKSVSAERRIALATIDSVWVLRHHNAIGGVIGGVLGGALAAAVVTGWCQTMSGCGSNSAFLMGFGVLIGGSAGLLAGSGIGWLAQTRRRIYP